MKWFISSMVEKLRYRMGFGIIPDDHPNARPISREVKYSDGSIHIITIDPDGRIHGLPGSSPEGLPVESYEAHKEKMKAFGK